MQYYKYNIVPWAHEFVTNLIYPFIAFSMCVCVCFSPSGSRDFNRFRQLNEGNIIVVELTDSFVNFSVDIVPFVYFEHFNFFHCETQWEVLVLLLLDSRKIKLT